MTKFPRQTATALRLIEKNGEACTWIKHAEAAGAEPWTPNDVATSYPANIVWTPAKRLNNQFVTYGGAEDLPTNTKFGLMASVGFVPEMRDQIQTSDGTIYNVAQLDPVNPDGIAILWNVEASR